jgi:hypothetical protein
MGAMRTFGAPVALIDAQHLTAADSVTQMGAPPIRIDLLSSLSGVTFDEALTDTIHVEIAGELLPVIGLAVLRQHKQATKRAKDHEDLRHLPAAPVSARASSPKPKPKPKPKRGRG